MPLRHPSENFIKFLVTTNDPRMQDNAVINLTLTLLGYPAADIDAEYLPWLRREVQSRLPPQFSPVNRYHRPSVRFMRQEGIFGLHNPDAASREASLITTHPRARPIVDELLLGHHHPVTVAKKVNSRLEEKFTADGIEAYRQYYWNVDLLRVEEWSTLLQQNNEKRSKAMAILQVGGAMALHQTGFAQELEAKAIMQEMQEAIYFDFLQWKKQPLSSERTKMMSTNVKSMALIDERMAESTSLLKDSLKNFEKFRMQHAKSQVVDMRALAPEGNFSGSGAKLLEAKQKTNDASDDASDDDGEGKDDDGEGKKE